MANADLLRRTLAHIQTHPDQWNQRTFREGDTGCFAFHAARLAGAELAQPEPEVTVDGSVYPNHAPEVALNAAARELGFTEDDEGRLDIEEFATRALELTSGEDLELFYANNSLEDLADFVEEYTAQDA